MWRKVTLYPPMDANDAMFPSVRVTGLAVRGLPVELPDALLVGLAAATGLDRFLLQDLDAAGRQHCARRSTGCHVRCGACSWKRRRWSARPC